MVIRHVSFQCVNLNPNSCHLDSCKVLLNLSTPTGSSWHYKMWAEIITNNSEFVLENSVSPNLTIEIKWIFSYLNLFLFQVGPFLWLITSQWGVSGQRLGPRRSLGRKGTVLSLTRVIRTHRQTLDKRELRFTDCGFFIVLTSYMSKTISTGFFHPSLRLERILGNRGCPEFVLLLVNSFTLCIEISLLVKLVVFSVLFRYFPSKLFLIQPYRNKGQRGKIPVFSV